MIEFDLETFISFDTSNYTVHTNIRKQGYPQRMRRLFTEFNDLV